MQTDTIANHLAVLRIVPSFTNLVESAPKWRAPRRGARSLAADLVPERRHRF